MANNVALKIKNGLEASAYFEKLGNPNLENRKYDFSALALKSETVVSGVHYADQFFWKPDGTELYFISDKYFTTVNVYGRLEQFSLSTAWDLSTLSLTNTKEATTINGPNEDYTGIWFSDDGSKIKIGRAHV